MIPYKHFFPGKHLADILKIFAVQNKFCLNSPIWQLLSDKSK